MPEWTENALLFMAGGFCGMLVMALCNVAARADRRESDKEADDIRALLERRARYTGEAN